MFNVLINLVLCFVILVAGASARYSNLFDTQDGGTKFKRQTDEVRCALPQPPTFGSYVIAQIDTPPVPGELVDTYTLLSYSCYPKYTLSVPNGVFCQEDGTWSHESVKCLRTCPPLVSASINYVCSQDKKPVPCSENMAVGTEADISCQKSYKTLIGALQTETIFCREDGTWDKPYVICTSECGTLGDAAKKYIANGTDADIAEFPWHVAIYDKTAGPVPMHICGGSIVSSAVVISAAHCFWDISSKSPRPKEEFAVGYGKVYSPWMDERDKHAIHVDIKTLTIYKEYTDIAAAYAHDIAILVLKYVIEFSNIIKPVCINWTAGKQVTEIEPGKVGKVAGWGWTADKMESSERLQQLSMPAVSTETCKEGVPWKFRSYITSDKLCAGSANGSNVCQGDSGGGLCFQDDPEQGTPFMLMGIVSTAPTNTEKEGCDTFQYTTFTGVLEYVDWLKRYQVHREPEIFRCNTGQNIIAAAKCDGVNDCPDNSDEDPNKCTVTDTGVGSKFEIEVGGCLLPEKPVNGSYSYLKTEGSPVAWTPTKDGTILKYECSENHVLNRVDNTIVCEFGHWSLDPPVCENTCPPLASDSFDFYCSLRGVQVPCNKLMPYGTKSDIRCKRSHMSLYMQTDTIACKSDGKWETSYFRCTAGRLTKEEVDAHFRNKTTTRVISIPL